MRLLTPLPAALFAALAGCSATTAPSPMLVVRSAPPAAADSIDGRLERIRSTVGRAPLEGPGWPLEVLATWRREIPDDRTLFGWTDDAQRIARVGLEAEWERTEHRYGPGPAYLKTELHRLFARLDDRFRPPRLRVRPEWPVTPVIVASPYGWRRDPIHGRRRFHSGIDLAGGRGDVVMATAPGEVLFAGWDRGYGRHVRVRHPGGWESLYGHLERIFVRAGDRIDLGSPVGLMGSTGRSTAPHLHFEVRRDGDSVDPERFVDEVGFLVAR